MLKKFYASKEQIPAEVVHLYVEKDGKFVLDVEGGLEDVDGLKSALSKERNRANTAETALKAWKESGIETPEKIRDLLSQIDEFSKLDPKKEADKLTEQKIIVLKKQFEEQFKLKETALIAENQKATQQLTSVLVDNEAHRVLAELKGSAKILLPHIKNHVKMIKDAQGNWAAQIIDADGNVRIGKDMKNMNIADLVMELKNDPDFARAFDGTGVKGSGGQGGSGNYSGKKTISASDDAAIQANFEKIATGELVVV